MALFLLCCFNFARLICVFIHFIKLLHFIAYFVCHFLYMVVCWLVFVVLGGAQRLKPHPRLVIMCPLYVVLRYAILHNIYYRVFMLPTIYYRVFKIS